MKRKYSVIIAVPMEHTQYPSLRALAKFPPEHKPAEVLLAVGNNPSAQRNAAACIARAPFLYFLDEDSQPLPATTSRLLSHFEEEAVLAAGGPNVVPLEAPPFEKTVASVLASWMGSFLVRNRYAPLGAVRQATEKDLILCNLMVRKNFFLSLGGFRENLFPNEENEFLNRALHHGYRLIYDPGAVIRRRPRKSFGEFSYQAFRYGRGRAQQIRIYPCFSDLIHFVPLFFVLYLVTLPLTIPFVGFLPAISPLLIFATGAFATGLACASWNRRFSEIFLVPALIFLRHFFYGAGFGAGLFLPQRKKPESLVRLFRVTGSRLQNLQPVKGVK